MDTPTKSTKSRLPSLTKINRSLTSVLAIVQSLEVKETRHLQRKVLRTLINDSTEVFTYLRRIARNQPRLQKQNKSTNV